MIKKLQYLKSECIVKLIVTSVFFLNSFFAHAQVESTCEINPLSYRVKNITKPDCNITNGVIAFDIDSGIGPFDVVISNKVTGEILIDRENLELNNKGFDIFSPGQYNVKVTASNGCEVLEEVNVISSFLSLKITNDLATCNSRDKRELVYNFANPSSVPGTLTLYEVLNDGSRELINNTNVVSGVIVKNFIKPNVPYLLVAERLSCNVEQIFSINECEEKEDQSVLSVNQINIDDAEEIKLYPNPTTGILTLRNNINRREREINVFDISGNNVFSTKTASKDFDISKLNTGCYLVKIKSGQNEFFKRIIKK